MEFPPFPADNNPMDKDGHKPAATEEESREPVSARAQAFVLAPLAVALAAILATRLGFPLAVCWDVAWTSAAVSAVAGCVLARRRALEPNRARWNLWTAAAAAWLFGQVAWDVYGVTGFPQSPSLTDAGWWAFAIAVMLSMLRIPGASWSVRLVALIESVPLIIAVSALTFAELWAPAAASTLPLAAKLSAVAYPALYVAATVLTLQAVVSGSPGALDTSAVRLVLLGIVTQALAFSLWSIQLLNKNYAPGHSLLDPLWVVGLLAIALGGLLSARNPEKLVAVGEPTYRGGILPAGMFLILPLALVQSQIAHTPVGIRIGLEGGLLCCGAALIARSTVLGRTFRSMLSRERAALANLAEREVELERLNKQLVEDSRRDPLTGVGNRRALAGDLPLLDQLQTQQGEKFAFVLCDADHFKAYNDRFGHLAGDQALRMIAATIGGALRAGDTAYRYGGEELLVVLRDVTASEAMKIAERVRAAVERTGFPHPDSEAGVLTVSIGVAAGEGATGELLARADAALYDAKRLGRNRVVAADEGSDHPLIGRGRADGSEEPVPRHLRSMLAVSRAAAANQGPMPVLEALAETICNELSFQVVAVNLLDETREQLRVVIVKGITEAREMLTGTSSPWSEWEALLDSADPSGAIWLPAGTYEWESEAPIWTPPWVAPPAPDGWHPEDMLLLPLKGASGEVLGIVSVDQPVLGRRPTEDELSVLMAVADHAGLALEQSQRQGEAPEEGPTELRLAVMLLLAEALDLRDPSTAQHSQTVGRYAREIARALGLPSERVERIHSAGVLHDLGKLGIADAILHKPGPLTDDEWVEMMRHPVIGAQILRHAGMDDIAEWIGAHHERLDGKGYPGGLSGPAIPLEARILAVADAYEAMVSARIYRPGMSDQLARAELLRCAGTQFDPDVVEAFLRTTQAPAADSAPALHPLPEHSSADNGTRPSGAASESQVKAAAA
jgi:diguanylate cyclase (GGDEF)-like protein/putative nucleotidyltransferase with HDIG domain